MPFARPVIQRRVAPSCMVVSILLLGACGDAAVAPGTAPDPAIVHARLVGSEVTVAAAKPDSGVQGTTLDVTITGSGFVSGSVADWALKGVRDANQVRTNSTRYVSSRELVANITISGTATIASWDIIVMAGPKTGIGTEKFAVKATGQAADPSSGVMFLSTASASNFRGDGLAPYAESDGSSRYKELECGVHVHIWNELSASGDVTFDSYITGGAKPKCAAYPRKATIVYDRINSDGSVTREATDAVTIFVNVNEIYHVAGAVMAVGGPWEERNMLIDPPATRCDQIRFRPILANGASTGSDRVEVRRTAVNTWEVRTKADTQGPNGETIHNDKAWCMTTGVLYHMPLTLRLQSVGTLGL